MSEINFSDRTEKRVDPHDWADQRGEIIYYDNSGSLTKVKDLTVHVCSRCRLALVLRPEYEHDLPPCIEKEIISGNPAAD